MSETKFTPGPYVCRIDECVKVRDKAGGLIAMLTHINHKGSRRDPDVVANTGKLFATAPDLHAALDYAVKHIEIELGYDHDAAVNGRAILAKVRGER